MGVKRRLAIYGLSAEGHPDEEKRKNDAHASICPAYRSNAHTSPMVRIHKQSMHAHMVVRVERGTRCKPLNIRVVAVGTLKMVPLRFENLNPY